MFILMCCIKASKITLKIPQILLFAYFLHTFLFYLYQATCSRRYFFHVQFQLLFCSVRGRTAFLNYNNVSSSQDDSLAGHLIDIV